MASERKEMTTARILGRRFSAAFVGLVLFVVSGVGNLAGSPEELVPLEVKVMAAADSKPIGAASVYVEFKEKRKLLKDKERKWHSKTNAEGLARFPGIPPGKVLIQVVAEGWKPFGHYYEIGEQLTEERQVVEVRLEKPRRWY